MSLGAVAAWLGQHKPRALAAIAMPFWLLAGVIGALLLFIWFGTEHRMGWGNHNLLPAEPTGLAGRYRARGRVLRGRVPGVWFTRILFALALCAAIGLFVHWLPMQPQRNAHWIALLLPIHAGLWLGFRRTVKELAHGFHRGHDAAHEGSHPARSASSTASPMTATASAATSAWMRSAMCSPSTTAASSGSGLYEPDESVLDKLQEEFGLHDLAIEDAHNAHQRPKVEAYGNSLFIAIHTAQTVDSHIRFGETHLFIGPRYLVTVRHGASTSYAPARARMEREPELLQHGPGAALYAVLDMVVDNYMPIVDEFSHALNELEQDVFAEDFRKGTVQKLYELKRELTRLRMAVSPLQDILGQLARARTALIDEEIQLYFRDVHDHAVRINETTDTLREMLTAAMSVNLSLVTIRQGEVVKRLAGWAALLAAPTLIASWYGMNFDHMPELAGPLQLLHRDRHHRWWCAWCCTDASNAPNGCDRLGRRSIRLRSLGDRFHRPSPHPAGDDIDLRLSARDASSFLWRDVMQRFSWIFWALLALLAAFCLGTIALQRGETISAMWLVAAAVSVFAIAYRFYGRYIAGRALGVDPSRATPAWRRNDGLDYVPTERSVLFGHHFAAIAGAGPLVGPVLAAQMGYLPGTLWILAGVVLAGAVQDMLVLFFSTRRDGRSLGEMIRTEMGGAAGVTAMIGILTIMVILLAVLALVVVKALAESPWGTFTVAMTIPIALLMGLYLRFFRPGRILEVSLIGLVLLLLSIWLGGKVAADPHWAALFHLKATTLAWLLIGYGFIAAVLPVWLLLAPRDYLCTFLKIGTVVLLAIAILFAMPDLQMPAISQLRRRHRSGIQRQALSVPVHHDRLRRGVGLPLAGQFRHHAEDDRQRIAHPPDRLRRHADGSLRRGDGAGRGLRAATRCVLRDERACRADRHHRRVRRRRDLELGLRDHSGDADRRRQGNRRGNRSSRAPAARRRSRWAWRRSSMAWSAARA